MIIAGYRFEDSYNFDYTTFNNVHAVYVIYSVINGQTIWLDVGETDKLANRLGSHERKACWRRNASGATLYVAVCQNGDDYSRKKMESDLRNRLLPVCGEK